MDRERTRGRLEISDGQPHGLADPTGDLSGKRGGKDRSSGGVLDDKGLPGEFARSEYSDLRFPQAAKPCSRHDRYTRTRIVTEDQTVERRKLSRRIDYPPGGVGILGAGIPVVRPEPEKAGFSQFRLHAHDLPWPSSLDCITGLRIAMRNFDVRGMSARPNRRSRRLSGQAGRDKDLPNILRLSWRSRPDCHTVAIENVLDCLGQDDFIV